MSFARVISIDAISSAASSAWNVATDEPHSPAIDASKPIKCASTATLSPSSPPPSPLDPAFVMKLLVFLLVICVATYASAQQECEVCVKVIEDVRAAMGGKKEWKVKANVEKGEAGLW